MPSPISDFHDSYITLLKELITKEFGQSITSKTDCDKLSELIESRTHKAISVNTLRRFFGIMPSKSKPSLETLNILSSFCGYEDFFDFRQTVARKESVAHADLTIESVNDLYSALGNAPQFYTTLSWFIKYAAKDNNSIFLKDFFELAIFKNELDYTKGELKKPIMTLGLELQANPILFDVFTKRYASNPTAHALYFECFVDYDFLTIRHHQAIRAYAKNKQGNEAKLFSLCLLFLHSFLLKDRLTCYDLLKQINGIEFSSDLHPFPSGRKMACNILYQSFYAGGVKPDLIKKAFDIEKMMPRDGLVGRNLPSYHTMVAEAFTLAGLHREAVSMIELAIQQYSTESHYNSQGILSSMWMAYTNALFQSQRVEESHEVFKKINTSHFDVHDRNYKLMQYYNLTSLLQQKDDPKTALSMKRMALEIATNHRFKFFQTLHG